MSILFIEMRTSNARYSHAERFCAEPASLWLCLGSKRLRRTIARPTGRRSGLSASIIPTASVCPFGKIRQERLELVPAWRRKRFPTHQGARCSSNRCGAISPSIPVFPIRRSARAGHSNADQYLTGADTKGHGPYKNSISLDQLYAEHIGDATRHASLVMSTNGGIGGRAVRRRSPSIGKAAPSRR